MPKSANHSGLRDNHTRGTVGDFLREKIHAGSLLSVVSAYFTIYAYDALIHFVDPAHEPPFSTRGIDHEINGQACCACGRVKR